MNKLKIFSSVLVLLLSISFFSCDNEPIDPALQPLLNPTEGCSSPTVFTVSSLIGGSNVNLSWDASADGSWQIQYGPQGFTVGSGTQVTATSNQATITGLTSTVQYEFYIRTVCGADSFSAWAGPVIPGASVGNCAAPTGVSALRSAGNTEITVNWAAGAGTSWDVQYGTAGFALGSGVTVTTTSPTKTVTGVLANVSYDFYVRSNCSSSSQSNWVGPVNVTASGVAPTGDYWPTSVGNQWVYKMNGVVQDPFSITSINAIGGFNYYTFNVPTQPNTGVSRIRKANGNYYVKTEQITLTTPFPGTQTGSEVIMLKDNVPVGTTWTDSFTQTTTYQSMSPITMQVSVTCTIEAKGVSVTVNGTTYNNVIKVNRVMTAGTTTYNGYYWYAKDVGPVKIMNNDGAIIQDLQSYIIN